MFIDKEFGAITVKRSHLARRLKLKIDSAGTVSISMPLGVPQFFAKRFVDQSRDFIRKHQGQSRQEQVVLRSGDLIGKTHKLIVNQGQKHGSRIINTELHVTLPSATNPESREAQLFIKEAALKALRVQAKSYLGRRLQTLAQNHGFAYTKLRFSTAGTRWGSCSSRRTISLNVWLMQLPHELIDYVLVHELCHTRHMNHSADFWGLVETIVPSYRTLRRDLKQQQPYL